MPTPPNLIQSPSTLWLVRPFLLHRCHFELLWNNGKVVGLQVIEMPEHNPGQMGGTMRLGKRRTLFKSDTSVMSMWTLVGTGAALVHF